MKKMCIHDTKESVCLVSIGKYCPVNCKLNTLEHIKLVEKEKNKIIYCQCCSRQLVDYECKSNDKTIVSRRDAKRMINGYCCSGCSEDLDENGLFPEERL